MFETANLDHRIGKAAYRREEAELREQLLNAQYERAACDMVDRTSTAIAPWTLVEANNKYYARIKVLKSMCDAIEAALGAK